MKIRLLQAFLISILILITPKIIAEESENLTCFKEIISKSEAVYGTGWAFVISSSDDNELQLENFLQQMDTNNPLRESKGKQVLINCSNFSSPEELYKKLKDNFSQYIKDESNIEEPAKDIQGNGNIEIFRDVKPKSKKDKLPPNNEIPEPTIQKEKINIKTETDELINSITKIRELFIDFELNQAPYREASAELIKMVKQKWMSIRKDSCEQSDKKSTIDKCEEKLNKIKSFKNENLPILKNIQTFKSNKTNIDSCFNSEGFNNTNCYSIEKISSEKSSEYLENLILQKKEKVEYFDQVYVGMLESDFVYEDFVLNIDNYVEKTLKPFINKTRNEIEDEINKKEEEEKIRKDKKKKEEAIRQKNEFIDLLISQSKFKPIDINIEKILSESTNLINKKVNTGDLEELKSYEDEILDLIEDIEEKIQYIKSQDDIDQIISNIKNLEKYKKYKSDSEVKDIIRDLDNEKNKRSNLIDQFDSTLSKLIDRKSSFETEKQLLENSSNMQNELENKIENLQNKNTTLVKDLESISKSKRNYMLLFILTLIGLLGFTAFYIYRFQQNRSSADHTLRSSFNEQYKQIINENKSLKQELEKIKNQIQLREQTSAPVKERTFKSRFDDEQSQETKPTISPLNEMLSFYDNVLRDPNKIDAFTNTYQAIALDRQSRIISQGETILVKDNKGFSKSNFWMVFIDNRYILLPGRTLNVNVSSLIADNYRYARDLLSGIFSYKLGNGFKMLQFAELEKNGDSFKVIAEGSLSLPQT